MKTYHIYGRTSYADPLTWIKAISVASDTNLSQTVLEEHGATDWIELVAIPDAQIIWARRAEAESES